jgi:DNA-directed RNA polymerase sigma subunit (sigma70/sigma32)
MPRKLDSQRLEARQPNSMPDPRWRSDEGWPYADYEGDVADRASEPDWDLLALHERSPKLFECLSQVERQVITGRFGVGTGEARTMKELRDETGLDHEELRATIGSGIAKLRAQLSDSA